MESESKSAAQFSDYPVNLFEESRDHANQWDVSTLSLHHSELPLRAGKKPERLIPPADYPVNLFEESRDHANQWDMTALLKNQEEKKPGHTEKE